MKGAVSPYGTLKIIAQVAIGPEIRRGILDKEGAEVVGGVVVSRFGANPMEVIEAIKRKISVLEQGMPKKILENGIESTLTIVPFYDRTQLIKETLNTLWDALNPGGVDHHDHRTDHVV